MSGSATSRGGERMSIKRWLFLSLTELLPENRILALVRRKGASHPRGAERVRDQVAHHEPLPRIIEHVKAR